MDAFANQPLVIDNGSGLMKAGLAGSETPKVIFPSYVGRPKHVKVMAGAAEGDAFVGDKARDLRGILKLNYPIKHGVVQDWDDMTNIWQHTYNELNCPSDQHPVLMTEVPLNPKSNRMKSAEVMFEQFSTPALYMQMQPILALYASGRTTGLVLDCGDGATSAVPVFEGFSLPHAISRTDVAGRQVTEYLQLLLRKAGYTFHTSAEMEVVRHIKEQKCFVEYSAEKAEADDTTSHGEDNYKLPDGQWITLGSERWRSTEVLFNPSLIGQEYVGVPQLIVQSINRSDLDTRRLFYSNILLSGGSTLFEGFGDRVINDVRKSAPRDCKIKIWAPNERIMSSWIGGSILASLATFKKMWITKSEFEDDRNIIYRKSF